MYGSIPRLQAGPLSQQDADQLNDLLARLAALLGGFSAAPPLAVTQDAGGVSYRLDAEIPVLPAAVRWTALGWAGPGVPAAAGVFPGREAVAVYGLDPDGFIYSATGESVVAHNPLPTPIDPGTWVELFLDPSSGLYWAHPLCDCPRPETGSLTGGCCPGLELPDTLCLTFSDQSTGGGTLFDPADYVLAFDGAVWSYEAGSGTSAVRIEFGCEINPVTLDGRYYLRVYCSDDAGGPRDVLYAAGLSGRLYFSGCETPFSGAYGLLSNLCGGGGGGGGGTATISLPPCASGSGEGPGSDSGSGGPCTGLANTCGCDCLPETLTLSLNSLSGCDCLTGSYLLTFVSGTSWEFDGSVCGVPVSIVAGCTSITSWTLHLFCDGVEVANRTTSDVTCSPLVVDWGTVSVSSRCCVGTVDAVITA